ncbi:hypothetical protein C8J56DRAFT_916675 [Mycena floridula]|nr:hypothetical protein C8J56DRAFT_916675 [Mycena floridula]
MSDRARSRSLTRGRSPPRHHSRSPSPYRRNYRRRYDSSDRYDRMNTMSDHVMQSFFSNSQRMVETVARAVAGRHQPYWRGRGRRSGLPYRGNFNRRGRFNNSPATQAVPAPPYSRQGEWLNLHAPSVAFGMEAEAGYGGAGGSTVGADEFWASTFHPNAISGPNNDTSVLAPVVPVAAMANLNLGNIDRPGPPASTTPVTPIPVATASTAPQDGDVDMIGPGAAGSGSSGGGEQSAADAEIARLGNIDIAV